VAVLERTMGAATVVMEFVISQMGFEADVPTEMLSRHIHNSASC
jgi:hypothetical protein